MAIKKRSARLLNTKKNSLTSADVIEEDLIIQRVDGSQIVFAGGSSEGGGGGGEISAGRTKIFELKSTGDASPGDITDESKDEGFFLPIGEESELTFTNTTYKFLEFEFLTQGWTVYAEGGPADVSFTLDAYTTMDEAAVSQFYDYFISVHPEYIGSFPNLAAFKAAISWPTPWHLPLGNTRVANLLDGQQETFSVLFKSGAQIMVGETVLRPHVFMHGAVIDPLAVVTLNGVHDTMVEVFGSQTAYTP